MSEMRREVKMQNLCIAILTLKDSYLDFIEKSEKAKYLSGNIRWGAAGSAVVHKHKPSLQWVFSLSHISTLTSFILQVVYYSILGFVWGGGVVRAHKDLI